MAGKTFRRLKYIDWMRGFACLTMFQTHCYDSWLSPAARQTTFFHWSQVVGTLPAPLFLFLAGFSFALVTDRLREKSATASAIAKQTIRRGAEILALGLLFRLQEWSLAFGHAPWTDLLRVDILNMLGVSMMMMGVACWIVGSFSAGADAPAMRWKNILLACAVSLMISAISPMVWTTWRPRWLPWPLESYIDGVHIFDKPQPWLFPIFPWSAIAFAGLAVGFIMVTAWARRKEFGAIGAIGIAGAAIGALAWWLDAQPRQIYANYDFWHTSPNFFLIRVGILCVILLGAYAWCRWGAAEWGFSPMIQMGRTSLLVYWVHIEFVYGGLSILKKGGQTILSASIGLAIIFVSMVLLSIARTRAKGKGWKVSEWFKAEPEAASA
jgi:acyltransferase